MPIKVHVAHFMTLGIAHSFNDTHAKFEIDNIICVDAGVTSVQPKSCSSHHPNVCNGSRKVKHKFQFAIIVESCIILLSWMFCLFQMHQTTCSHREANQEPKPTGNVLIHGTLINQTETCKVCYSLEASVLSIMACV